MKTFEFELLHCHFQHLNVRTQVHGEDEKLAVDVNLRLMMGDTGDEWTPVLSVLLAGDDAQELVERMAGSFESARVTAAYEHYKVIFKSTWSESMPELATLTDANINKFTIDLADLGMTFRIQAETDSETIGKLSELINRKVGIEVIAMQIPLALPPQEGDEPDGRANEAGAESEPGDMEEKKRGRRSKKLTAKA